MDVPTIAKGPELAELIAADPEYAGRYHQCLMDIEACKSVQDLRRCASAANLRNGYEKEWNSHHGMVQRAAKDNISLSDSLRSFAAFLVHVGPKPHYETTGKLSIDKTNSKGYLVGYIRWQTPEGQTRNRRTSTFHIYKSRYYNDKALAVLLSTLSGKVITTDAVKKRRQRGKTTVDQFVAAGVPYESGAGALSDWDFPLAYVNRMAPLFRVNHYKGETRIAFFVRWLRTREIPRFESLMLQPGTTSDQRAELRTLTGEYGHSLSFAELQLKKLQRENVSNEIANSIYQPFSPAGADAHDAKPTYFGNDAAQEPVVFPASAFPVAAYAAKVISDEPVSSHVSSSAMAAEGEKAHPSADGLGSQASPANQETPSILDPVKDAGLIADLPRICKLANVHPEFVRRSSKPFLTAPELDWICRVPEHRRAGRGLVLTGVQQVSPDLKFQAMAGVLLRNYTDARFMTVHTLLSLLEDGERPAPTVLLIPNLFGASQSKLVHELYDFFINRRCGGKVTAVYVEDLAKMERAFGWLFAQHLKDNYEIIDTTPLPSVSISNH